MALDIVMTGSGELGDIAPGWSVAEFATPIVPGDTAGGTGTVSFSAAARESSLFVVNNNITTTVDGIGSISGIVKSVSQTGLNIGINHNNKLGFFDANFKIPALSAGGVYPAVDLCSQLVGRDKLLNADTGFFYSMHGHSAGFDKDGTLASASTTAGVYTGYNPSLAIFYNVDWTSQVGMIWATDFTTISNEIWATSTLGDSFPNDKARPSQRIAYKTLISAGNNTTFSFDALPDSSSTSSGQACSVVLNYNSDVVTLSGSYRVGGTLTNYTQDASIAGLNRDSELAVFIEYRRPVDMSGAFDIYVYVCNTSDYSTYVTTHKTFTTVESTYNAPWSLTGTVRSIWRAQDVGLSSVSDFVKEYENPATFNINHTVQYGNPVPAVEMNVWEYLQNACTAYGHQISIINDVIEVDDIDTNILDITNIVGSPTISPATILGGRNVELVYSNSQSVKNVELYSAYDDNNRVISVKTSEVITNTVSINGTPAVISLPTRSTTPPNGDGQYCITYSNGAQVPQGLFEQYGGKLQVQLSTTVPNAIDIVLTGPNSGLESAGYAGPYSLAYQASGTNYAALSIMGSGILTNSQTLKLLTAADPSKVSQDIAKTVTNPFICTREQAFDRGLLVAIEASGPKVTMSGSLPVSAVPALGLTPGKRIYYRDSIYRVTDATIGNLAVSFNAVRHVTVNDFDTLWAGRTVGVHDETWNNYETQDQVIAPLRLIGDDESVIMQLDVDVNPYYDLTGEPDISVFEDVDDTPFYSDGGDAPGSDPVYLDDDINPYV